MTDVTVMMREFDRRMDDALYEAEEHLRSGGASDWELVMWKECFLPVWQEWVSANRRILLANLTEPQSTTPH